MHRIMQTDAIRPEFCGSTGDFGVVMATVVFAGWFPADWCIETHLNSVQEAVILVQASGHAAHRYVFWRF
jgi:hypothetical protein